MDYKNYNNNVNYMQQPIGQGQVNYNNYTPSQTEGYPNIPNINSQNNINMNTPGMSTPVQNNMYNPPNYQFWNVPNQQSFPNINEKEYILLDGTNPNKKKKYVYVGEVDVSNSNNISLEDIKKIISDEFDRRFGEEKHE